MGFFEWLRLAEDVSSTATMLKTLLDHPEERVPGAALRLVLADSMDEDGRANEASVLRSGKEINLEQIRSFIKLYVVVDGTSYDAKSDPRVIDVLERCRVNRTRIRLSYGHTSGEKAGLDSLIDFEVEGRVGRSTGSIKIPILVRTTRSMGGGAIDPADIVKIRLSNGGQVLYQHPNYRHGKIEIKKLDKPVSLGGYRWATHALYRDDEHFASFEDEDKAGKWAKKMGLKVEKQGE